MLFLVGFEPKETLETSQDTVKAAQQSPVSALTQSGLQPATITSNASQLSKAADSTPVIQDELLTTAQAAATSSGPAAEQPLSRAQQGGVARPSGANSHSTFDDQPSTSATATAAEQQRDRVAARQPLSAATGAATNAAAGHFAAKGLAAVFGKRAGAALAAPEMSGGPWSIKAGAVEAHASDDRSQQGNNRADNHKNNKNNIATWQCPFIAYLPWPFQAV